MLIHSPAHDSQLSLRKLSPHRSGNRFTKPINEFNNSVKV